MSAGAPYLSCAAGKVWFEVEALESSGQVLVGAAGTSFRGDALGLDAASWGIFSDSGKTLHGCRDPLSLRLRPTRRRLPLRAPPPPGPSP